MTGVPAATAPATPGHSSGTSASAVVLTVFAYLVGAAGLVTWHPIGLALMVSAVAMAIVAYRDVPPMTAIRYLLMPLIVLLAIRILMLAVAYTLL